MPGYCEQAGAIPSKGKHAVILSRIWLRSGNASPSAGKKEKEKKCLPFVLVQVSLAVIKHHDHKPLGKEGFISSYTAISQPITEGSQARTHAEQELMQRPWISAVPLFAPDDFLNLLSLTPNATSQGMAPPIIKGTDPPM